MVRISTLFSYLCPIWEILLLVLCTKHDVYGHFFKLKLNPILVVLEAGFPFISILVTTVTILIFHPFNSTIHGEGEFPQKGDREQ